MDRVARALNGIHLHLHDGNAFVAGVDNRAQAREDDVAIFVHLVGAGTQRQQLIAPLGHNARIERRSFQNALHKFVVFRAPAELPDAPGLILFGGLAHTGENLRDIILIRRDEGQRRMLFIIIMIHVIGNRSEHAAVFAVVAVEYVHMSEKYGELFASAKTAPVRLTAPVYR